MKPLTAEAWIIARLLIHASKTPTFYSSPELPRTVLYLSKEYGRTELDKAFKALRKEAAK